MTSRELRNLCKSWIVPALKSVGGSAHYIEVYKYIWKHHESDIVAAGDLAFYRWQYELSHAATELRKAGTMKEAKKPSDGIWAIS